MRTLISTSFVSLDGKLDPTGGETELRDTRWTAATVDFVPEAFLSVLGLADDALVFSWVAASVVNETESFLAWERTTPRRTGSGRDTVPGHVVR